jgi:signal transduction histidine kinase
MFTADRLILGKTLREHIGGRWAISLVAYVINAPINILSILSNANAAQDQKSSPLWLLVAVVGYLALGVVVWIASATVFRNRQIAAVPIWWVVVLGFVAGGTRGVVVGFSASELGLSGDGVGVVATRILTGAFMGAVLIPIAALVLSVISTYRHERTRLLEEQVEVERAVFHNTGVTQTLRGALIESVRTDLENVQTSTQARELSHRIWEQEEPQGTRHVSWWRVVRTSIFVNPYATFPVVLLWTMSAIGTLGLSIGFGPAIGQITFSAAVILAMFWLGKQLNNVRSLPGLLVFVVVMAVTVFLTSVVASVLFDPRPWPAGLGLMVSNALWLPLLTVLVGIAITAVRSSEQVIDTLESEVTQSELIQVATERELDGLRKELASQLHGSVQSRLLITAALLDNGEFARIAPLVDPFITAEVMNALDTSPITSATEAINALAQSWQGLMRVDVQLPDERVLRTRTEAIVRVVEEGLSNAFRHGKATEVSIRITSHGESMPVASVRIEVEDNGVGLPSDFVKGLGLTVIESLKPVVCELVNISGAGCRMVVEFVDQV